MPVNISVKGLSKNGPEFQKIADNLQGNILKSHARDHTSNIFFSISAGKVLQAKAFLRSLNVTSARTAALQAESTNKNTLHTTCSLSAEGYRALGVSNGKTPQDPNFRGGMKASADTLGDQPITWESDYRGNVHGIIILAMSGIGKPNAIGYTARPAALNTATAQIVTAIKKFGTSFVQRGAGLTNPNGDGIEHNGYVDGISQPKFFKEDVINPNTVTQWNPLSAWDLVLVADPGAGVADAFGSYMVYRKLEQNVSAFKQAEEDLAQLLYGHLPTEEFDKVKELAGAMVVGRFENGMPVKVSDVDSHIRSDRPHGKIGIPVDDSQVGKINNFNYNSDGEGAKCPFHAHIRKSNPRGESAKFLADFGVTEENERRHTMARRGIPFGTRTDKPNGEVDAKDRPTGGLGLLFMSFQSDISNQFEFIQSTWVNNQNFVKPDTGQDPIIGQSTSVNTMANGQYEYTQIYNEVGSKVKPVSSMSFEQFVTMKGGEYFFSPSLNFLRNLI